MFSCVRRAALTAALVVLSAASASAAQSVSADELAAAQAAASAGDPAAQDQLSVWYNQGQNVKQDYAEAFRWAKKAADQGDLWGQYYVGVMYLNGQGVAQSDAEALDWTKRAADKGFAPAQAQLGTLYFNGTGVPRDCGQALERTRAAVKQRYAPAREALNRMQLACRNPPAGKLKEVPAPTRAASATHFLIDLVCAALAAFGLWNTRMGSAVKDAVTEWRRPKKSPEIRVVTPPPPAPAPPAPKPKLEEDLLGALKAGRAAAVAASYAAAKRSRDLTQKLLALAASRPDALGAYGRALLMEGDYEPAYELLKRAPGQDARQGKITHELRRVLARRTAGSLFVAQQSYEERLTLANAFSEKGFHDEALAMLTDEVVDAAGKDEADAYMIAEHFHAAGKGAGLVARASQKERQREFLMTYAAALHAVGSDEAALVMLEKGQPQSPQDYALFLSVHKSLGTLAKVDPRAIPEEQRVLLVEGLLDLGDAQAAAAVVETIPKARWRAREFGAALRLLPRLGRAGEALALQPELRRAVPLEKEPEVHFYFAMVCEKAGEFGRAKEVYRELIARHGRYRDADERLRNIEALPAEEATKVSTMLSVAARATQANADIAAFIAGLEEKERTAIIGDRFLIIRHLGIGGMGIVYRARDLRMPRDVALKRLRGELAADPAARARFLEEAKTISALSHANIVKIHDVVEFAGTTYLVFECVEGETLQELVTSRGPFPPRDAVGILRQICAGMAHAHAHGVIHRDLKPGNVMIGAGNRVKVMDFGLAGRVDPAASGSGDQSAVGGTPAYMAPEQHSGRTTFLSDVYSLGATAYEILTGRMPFSGPDMARVKAAERYEPLPIAVPARLAQVVGMCLKADPAARPQGITAVADQLAAVYPAG